MTALKDILVAFALGMCLAWVLGEVMHAQTWFVYAGCIALGLVLSVANGDWIKKEKSR